VYVAARDDDGTERAFAVLRQGDAEAWELVELGTELRAVVTRTAGEVGPVAFYCDRCAALGQGACIHRRICRTLTEQARTAG
jgi:hypothetical protein